MKTLSISLYNRPKYTKILFDHLDQCFGINEYIIFIYCEPNNYEVIELANLFRPQQTVVKINNTKLGCNKNIFQALNNSFMINNFHIHLEDDTIPGKDFLIYCQWCREYFANDQDIFSVSGYVNSNNKIAQHIDLNTNFDSISTRNWFTPWGWATWKDRWDTIKENIESNLNSTNSWDVTLHNIIRDRKECFPVVSRIQNIGAENGTYCPGPEWHRTNQYNEYWIESTQQHASKFEYKQ